MALEIIRGDEDVPLGGLSGRTVAIIGYGNQGRAHALNLRDTAAAHAELALRIVVGARPSRLPDHPAVDDGLETLDIADATALADLVIIALPDEIHEDVVANDVMPSLKDSASMGFLHGFSVHYGFVRPPRHAGLVLVAPKGPGAAVRDRFLRGQGLPALLAVQQDSTRGDAEHLALAWANAIGAARAGIIRTTFAQETETDLFGEQSVLCGGMLALIRAAIETLVREGYPRELAYIECCHELKQIADLVYERGLAGMSEAISTTAEFGMHSAAAQLEDARITQVMDQLLEHVQSGAFARSMRDDAAAGSPWLQKQRARLRDDPNEAAGEVVRSLMPWLRSDPPEHISSSES